MPGVGQTVGTPHSAAFQPLLGVRVLELADGVAAMFCGRILHWLGAEVVRLESEGTDAAARWSVGDDGFGAAAYDYCNAGKQITRTATPDLALLEALPDVDLLLSDRRGSQLAGLGLDPADVARTHPELVLVSVTGYGLTGPRASWAATELTTYHAGGEGYLLPGDPVFSKFADRPPVRGGRFLADYDTGLAAACGALAAILRHAETGRGDVVEISAQEVQLGLNRTTLSRCFYEGIDVGRGDRGYDYGGLLAAADGWITLRPTEDSQWRSFAQAIGRPDLADDPRYATRAARDRHGEALTEELTSWAGARTRAEIRDVVIAAGCPGGPFLEVDEVLADPSLEPRDLFVESAGGRAPGRVFDRAGSAPASDRQHRPVQGGGPLSGYRVLDMTWVAAGPYATELLAFFGAEVIKIESRQRPDLFRRLLLENSDDLDTSIRFVDLNQHKKSICLDLKTPEGRELLVELAATCDVVVDNFRPGVRDRLGIGDDVLRAGGTPIVSAGLSGFGTTGPMRDRPGYASVFNAESGIGAMTGYADSSPTEIRDSNDLRAGMATCCAALAALVERARHGRASSMEVAAREVLIALQGDAILEASRTAAPSRTGNALGRLVPYGCWLSADDRWVAVSVTDTAQWQTLVEVVGAEALRGPDLKDASVRWERRDEVEAVLAGWLRSMDAATAVARLGTAGVPAAQSSPAGLLRADEHLNARGFFSVVEHAKLGDVAVIGPPVRFWSAGGPAPAQPSPLLGEHTRTLLAELGRDDAQIARLYEGGVVA